MISVPPFVTSINSVQDYCREIRLSYVNIPRLVVPAWTAGTQVDMDVSGRILRAWMPAIHAGMTEAPMGKMLSNMALGVKG